MRAWMLRIAGVAAALALAIPAAGSASEGVAVAADVRVSNGMGVIVEAANNQGVVLLQTLYGTTRRIDLDCVEVREYPNPHHYFAWPPFHVMLSSGLGPDGTRYYVTAYDYGVLGVGSWRDAIGIVVESGDAPCGASWEAQPIVDGDIAVLG